MHYPSAYVFDIVTERDIVQFAALQYGIDEGDVLCRIMAADMHPYTTPHCYVTEHPLNIIEVSCQFLDPLIIRYIANASPSKSRKSGYFP